MLEPIIHATWSPFKGSWVSVDRWIKNPQTLFLVKPRKNRPNLVEKLADIAI
jgi:hypothetical protein